ncbi:MAG: diaminopimelate epimerase [Bacteroidales bacterium]|nr:diaminopimelate epimerase [Bacteroidales bacterium]
MGKRIRFTKMQGAGNDYVYINCFEFQIDDPHTMAEWVSDRHFGIGSDGLVLIMSSESCDFRMRMFNSDGSEAEMCGNATRCVGKYVYDNKLTDKTDFTLETKAGVKYLSLTLDAKGKVSWVKVDMGEPILKAEKVPVISKSEVVVDEPIEIDGKVYKMTCVSMGNPHAVVFVDDVKSLDINILGPKFENHKAFPKRTNTEFVEIVSATKVKMRVWERGAGETLACGTGACATLVACCLNKKTENRAEVELLGGSLEIEWNKDTNKILMSGPAKTVFDGEFDWE